MTDKLAEARKLERDAIVAWLSAAKLDMTNDYELGVMLWAIETIKRGDHLATMQAKGDV